MATINRMEAAPAAVPTPRMPHTVIELPLVAIPAIAVVVIGVAAGIHFGKKYFAG
jgi:hypothetical protein